MAISSSNVCNVAALSAATLFSIARFIPAACAIPASASGGYQIYLLRKRGCEIPVSLVDGLGPLQRLSDSGQLLVVC